MYARSSALWALVNIAASFSSDELSSSALGAAKAEFPVCEILEKEDKLIEQERCYELSGARRKYTEGCSAPQKASRPASKQRPDSAFLCCLATSKYIGACGLENEGCNVAPDWSAFRLLHKPGDYSFPLASLFSAKQAIEESDKLSARHNFCKTSTKC